MKRGIATILILVVVVSVWAVKPYYRLGESQKSVNELTAEITKLLLGHEFEILGMYHPNLNDDYCVIIFSCDQMTSMATSVNNKGAFGAALKIGLVKNGDQTDITMINPFYIRHAYFNDSANKYEAGKMTSMTDSLVKRALKPLISDSTYFGRNMSAKELSTYHFLPTLARFEDVIELNEYGEYIEAITIIKNNLLNELENSALVYELTFHDKEIAVFGISFQGKNNPEKELLELVGTDCISSMPYEILVQGNKAYMLNGRYRIPLFKTDLNWKKTLKLFDIASDYKSSLKKISKEKD